MQQFTVPQFIDVESKIIGPITSRQFVIMMACFSLMGIGYKVLDFSGFLVTSPILFAIFGTFAFAKVNGRPFHLFILNLVETFKKANIRVWNHTIGRDEVKEHHKKITVHESLPPIKHFSTSRLAELALIVDTKGVYRGEGISNGEASIEVINKNKSF